MKTRLNRTATPAPADSAVLARLRRQLRNWFAGNRAAAAEQLGLFQDREAVPALVALLSDRVLEVRREAVRALGRIGDPAAAAELSRAIRISDLGLEVREALHLLGAPAIPYLSPRLLGGGERGDLAARALAAIGAPALPALADGLQHTDWEVRCSAVQALGSIHEPSTARLLVPMLRDPKVWVRARAAEALGRLRAVEAVPALIEALGDREVFVRSRAAWSLGEIPDPRGIPPLCRGLRDPDPSVTLQATAALGMLLEHLGREKFSGYQLGPELRAVLPMLRQLCLSLEPHWVQHPDPRHTACRRLIEKIEAITASCKDLPVPIATVVTGGEDLPRPAYPAQPEAGRLPIAAEPDRE